MRNKKIIAFICAISMLISLFTSFTTASADGATRGLYFDVKSSTTTKVVVDVKYDTNSFAAISGAVIILPLPDGATVEFTKPVTAGSPSYMPNAEYAGGYLLSYGNAGDYALDGGLITTLTITLEESLAKDAKIALAEGSSVTLFTEGTEYVVGDDEYPMVAESFTIAADPDKAVEEPFEKDTDYDSENVVIPESKEEVTVENGLVLDLVKAENGKAIVDVKYTGFTAISGAVVILPLPDGATVEFTKPVTAGSPSYMPNVEYAGGYLLSYGNSGDYALDNNLITTLTITYDSAEDYILELAEGSSVTLFTEGTEYVVGDDEYPLVADWITLPATTEDDRNVVDLDDKISSELAEKADEGTADAYLAIEATDEDGKPATYGTDYEAYYNGQKINEDTLKALLAGEVEDVTLEDAVKGLSFKYNDGVKIKFQLVVGDEVADNGETEDDTPVTPGKDLSADGKIASKVSKSIKSNASKQTATFTVTPAKDKDGNVIVSDEPHVTITVKKSSYDAITGSGIEVAYTDYEIEDTDNDDDYEEAAVKTKTYYVYPSIQEADTEITLPDALDYKYEVSFTPAAKGTVEYTMTYYDANGKKAEATAKYTISEASTKSSSSGSSSDSKSSGGGAIATGLVDTGAGYLPSLGFDDLGDVEWAQTAINSLAAKKIVSGVGDNKFDPNAALTRAAYAQMLVNAIGHSQDSADVEFADVPTDSWFYHNVAVAAQLGIVSGYGDGNFGPYDLITREQMALMTQKAAVVMGNSLIGADNGTFTDDADIADWAHDAVYTLSNAGIINGMGDGTFAPKANATRAQAAVIIYNTFVK